MSFGLVYDIGDEWKLNSTWPNLYPVMVFNFLLNGIKNYSCKGKIKTGCNFLFLEVTNMVGVFIGDNCVSQPLFGCQAAKDVSECLQHAFTRNGLDMRVAVLVGALCTSLS